MSEGKTNMFGKAYNTIGSTDSNFIIKTKGDLKVQWGNKFIDVIKNGKLSSNNDLIKQVSSSDNISGTGIFVTNSNEVWLSINGTKISIGGNLDETYVSFLTSQESITQDQKYQALTNIGFYYDTLDNAKDVSAGIVYVKETNKLYIVKDGELKDYYLEQISGNSQSSSFSEINIGNLKIYSENNNSIVNSPNLKVLINNEEFISLDEDIKVNKNISIENNVYIQSKDASSDYGFRLYNTEQGSTLEIDNIIERNSKSYNGLELYEKEYFSDSNVITSISRNGVNVTLNLKYSNKFEIDQNIYIFIQETEGEKKVPKEYSIKEANQNYIVIEVDEQLDIDYLSNTIIYLKSSPIIEIDKNTVQIKEDDNINTIIGSISEEIFSGENIEETQKSGIYSKNFIGIGSKLYDSIFKKQTDYPKYDDSIELPQDLNNDQYNQTVPNLKWIKELLKLLIPSGTIVMYSGSSDIPEGWAICDGNNGTPNLVGKFIKAVSSSEDIGENTTDLNDNNELTIKEENLPEHHHPHNSHTHTIQSTGSIQNSTSLSVQSSEQFINNLTGISVITSVEGVEGITTTSDTVYNGISKNTVQSTGGVHSHTLSIESSVSSESSTESEITWTNKKIKVEPNSYSLIFIMKL